MDVLHDLLTGLLVGIDPGLSYGVALYGAVLASIGTHPVRITTEQQLLQLVLIKLRQLLLLGFLLGIASLWFLVYPISRRLYGSDIYSAAFETAAADAVAQHWMTIPFAILVSWLATFVWQRQLAPYLSHLQRRLRVRQSGDALSDVRIEQGALSAQQFDPRRHYRDGYIFFGLDERGQPIYETEDDFKSRNLKVLGPTQTGKGVLQGVLIDQAILRGWTVVFVNPKPDRFIPGIMRQACSDAGREAPLELDLTGQGTGKYAPFASGTSRQRRTRLLWAFGLNDDGGQADFYKGQEREVLDGLLPRWDGGLAALLRLLHPRKGDAGAIDEAAEIWKKTARLRGNLGEWLAHKPLAANAGQGFDLARTIQHNRVAHVRASVSDPLVIRATSVLLMDLIQTVETLGDEPRPHIFVVIDETKFMLTDVLARGLATILDKGASMVIAYQTVKDLLSLEDKRLNPEAIKSAIENNCKYTVCYQAQDYDTAQWAADMSGTVQKTVPKMERVETNRLGGELWSQERTLSTVSENLLSPNRMLMLPARVAALFRPGQLAALTFTSWVPLRSPALAAQPTQSNPQRREPAPSEPQASGPEQEPTVAETDVGAQTTPGPTTPPTTVQLLKEINTAAGKPTGGVRAEAPTPAAVEPAPSRDDLAKLSEDLSKL